MTNVTIKITPRQEKALIWLSDHGGDGAFVKGGATIIAQGEIAPHERATWVALRDARRVEFYNPNGKGYGRVRMIPDPSIRRGNPVKPKNVHRINAASGAE